MNITHVAIYAGDGYIVDASSSKGQVVYRKLISGHVLYGRPGILHDQYLIKQLGKTGSVGTKEKLG